MEGHLNNQMYIENSCCISLVYSRLYDITVVFEKFINNKRLSIPDEILLIMILSNEVGWLKLVPFAHLALE